MYHPGPQVTIHYRLPCITFLNACNLCIDYPPVACLPALQVDIFSTIFITTGVLTMCRSGLHRYKNFTFPRSTQDMLTTATKWLKGTYAENWAPKPDPADVQKATPKAPVTMQPKLKKTCLLAQLMSHTEASDDDSGNAADEADKPCMNEVEAYLALPQQPAEKHGVEFDLLDWWKRHATMFPNLSRMARQFLATPACSSGVERLFSAVGRMHDDFRKGSKEVTLQHLTLVYKNLA